MQPGVNYQDFRSFHKLKKALNLRVDLDIGQRWGSTYCCQADMSFLVKRYEGQAAEKFLRIFVQNYENALLDLAEEEIRKHIEIVPFLYVGDDFIIKPWVTRMIPFGEIRMDCDTGQSYLALVELIKSKTKKQSLKDALLRSAEKETTYLNYRENKLVFVDLDFD